MGVSRRMAQFGLGAAVAVLLLCLSILVAGGTDAGLGDGLVGARARNFHLRDLHNRLVSLSDLHGKVVSIYFSGDTPKPEVQPQVAALQNAYGNDPRVQVLAVYNDDFHNESLRGLIAASAKQDQVATLTDPTSEVSKLYRVGQIPTLFVIDQDGVIRLRRAMADSGTLLDNCHRTIDSLLTVKSPAPTLAQGVLPNVK